MRKDPTEFRKRFAKWKETGEYELPRFGDGEETVDWKRWDDAQLTSYSIPFIKEKKVKLTNAGRATGAVLSTNLLDSIADNADRAGLPLETALGIAVKESTLGNPTDDRSAWKLSSGIRKQFNDVYPGTSQYINPGRSLNAREDVINYHKGHLSDDPNSNGKSVLLEAFEFYGKHPDKYNTGLKGYLDAVNKRGSEVMLSPEILAWKTIRDSKKAYQNSRWVRPNPALNKSRFNLPKFEGGEESVRVGDYNVYPSAIGASELNVTTPEIVVTGKDRRPVYLRYDAEHSTYDPKLITNFTGLMPVVGDIQDATMAVDAYNNKDYLSAGMLSVGLLLPNALEKTGKYAIKTGLKYFPEATKSAYDIFHLYKTPKDNPRLRRYADDVASLLKSDEMQARGYISSDRYLQQINNIRSAPAYFTHSRHTFIRPQFKLAGKEFTSPIPLPYGYRGMYSPNKHSFTVSRGKYTPDEIRHTTYHEASHASDRGRGTAGYMSIEPKEKSLYYDMPTEKRARVISILTDAYKNGININDITELGNFINKDYINSNYSSLLKNYKTTDGKSFISNMLYTP